jgi:hypothetical protein
VVIEFRRILGSVEDDEQPNFSQICEMLGIPVKVNIDSGGKPNGVPERR